MKLSLILGASLLCCFSIACKSDMQASDTQTEVQKAEVSGQEAHTAITTQGLEPYQCGSIQRLHTMQGVFLASQPSAEDLAQAKMGGVRTVINMRHDKELKFDERNVVEGLELGYQNPAWNGPDELTDEIFAQYRTLLDQAERPILLHCGSGNRVGAVWLPWRVLNGGATVEEALAEAKTIGMRSPDYERLALDYIRRMKK